MSEIWKDVVGYEGLYQVSDFGQVRSVDRMVNGGSGMRMFPGRIRRQSVATNGYLCVSLSKFGKIKVRLTHALCLESFIGERPDGFDACHNNGDRMNNAIHNLRWASRMDNIHDKESHGTNLKGADSPSAVLTEIQVREIKILINEGMGQTAISKLFGVAVPTIHSIKVGKSWGRLDA